MPEQNITLIAEQEAGRLCASDPNQAKTYATAIRRNCATWSAYLAEDPRAAEWALLDAYLARLDVTEHRGSPVYLERFDWARSVAFRLLERDGEGYARAHLRRAGICYLFAFPGFTENGGRRTLPQLAIFG